MSDGVFVAALVDAGRARWIASYAGTDAKTQIDRIDGIKDRAAASQEDGVELRKWEYPEDDPESRTWLLLDPLGLFGYEVFL